MAPSRTLLALLAFSPLALANINFTWIQPSCSPTDTYSKCLKGQHCEGTACVPDYSTNPDLVRHSEKRDLSKRQSTAPRSDGLCGANYGGATCDPAGAFGGCCSAYGYCGSTAAYCLASNGCVSGCTTTTTPPVTTDGTCGAANGGTVCGNWPQGGCCSSYGWCGNTPAHCGTGCQSGCTSASSTSSAAAASSSAAVTTDGTCGAANGGTVCGNWPQGGCCSQYGWCGNTPAHCGTGCQSGCSSASSSSSSAPAASSSAAVTTDGTCGAANGGTVCGNWPQGGCCSQYGWCGNTPAHCGTGCQSGCNSASSSSSSIPASSSTSTATSTSTSTSATASSTAPVTTDGSCGVAFGGTVCGNWVNGNCCSMYGYCGSDSAHCGQGCQSGNCTGPPDLPAPGPISAPMNANPGSFAIVGQSGVPAMHMGLLPNGKVVFLDKIENYTQLTLPDGYYAYSSEYDPKANSAVPLQYATNSFCAGGMPLANGTFMAVGGNAPLDFIDPTVGDGFTGIRYLTRSPTNAALNGQNWVEPGNKLSSPRWYPSAQIMPDGTIFVASGSLNGNDPTVPTNNNPTYEILDRNGISSGVNITMQLLVQNQPYYMYPFIHLLNNGNLFVFVSKMSQIFNVASNTIVTTLPELAGDYRTYPNTGGSVMMPLSSANGYAPDIIICGGGPYQDITAPTDASCGRIQPLSANPTWELDAMPEGRCMVEANLLLDGTVLWLNGVNQGAQGFGEATNPTYEALIYDPTKALGTRWTKGASSTIGRLYHSVSVMLMDGTIMVAGSNPVQMPMLEPDAANPWVTEFRVEIYTPPYLSGNTTNLRPTAVTIPTSITPGGATFNVKYTLPSTTVKTTKVVLYYTGFVTHSLHMGHRMVYCDFVGNSTGTAQSVMVTPPPTHNITPPGYYILFVVADGVPSIGQMIMVN